MREARSRLHAALLDLADRLGLTAYRFSQDTGISIAYAQQLFGGAKATVGHEIALRIADTYKEPRVKWLRLAGYAQLADAILEAQGFEEVPVLGTVAAGEEGSTALDEPGTAVVPKGFLQGADIALPVVGDSMEPTVPAGSIAAVKLTRRVPNKGLVVVLLPTGEHVLKRWIDTPDGPKLASDNPAYPPLLPEGAQIVGVPVRFTRIETWEVTRD